MNTNLNAVLTSWVVYFRNRPREAHQVKLCCSTKLGFSTTPVVGNVRVRTAKKKEQMAGALGAESLDIAI